MTFYQQSQPVFERQISQRYLGSMICDYESLSAIRNVTVYVYDWQNTLKPLHARHIQQTCYACLPSGNSRAGV